MMLFSGRWRLCFALAAIVLASAPAQAQDASSTPLPSHLPLRAEACFGRSYDAAHLAKHPKQRVTSLYLFRDFTPDPTTESVPVTREELLQQDGSDGNVNVTAYVRLRAGFSVRLLERYALTLNRLGVVMAGLVVPAIHVFRQRLGRKDVDARHKAGHDGEGWINLTRKCSKGIKNARRDAGHFRFRWLTPRGAA